MDGKITDLTLPEIKPNDIAQTLLGTVLPDEIKHFEEVARQEKRLRNFEKAGNMFLNLANWYESQNECLLRKKWGTCRALSLYGW